MNRKHPVITNFEARSVLLLAGLTLCVAGHAIAQGTAKPMVNERELGLQFAKADSNGDKSLSAEEAKTLPMTPVQFERSDANKDGALSVDEFLAQMKGVKLPTQ